MDDLLLGHKNIIIMSQPMNTQLFTLHTSMECLKPPQPQRDYKNY